MQELDWWMTVENERRLLFWMSCGMIVCGLLAFVVLLMIPAPYGRYSSASWGWLMDSRAAWFMQELPSLLVPVILWPCSDAGTKQPNTLLLGAFIVHYIHRFIRFIWHYCSFMHTSKHSAIDRAHARSTSARNVLLTVRMRTVNKCVKCAVDRAQARSTSA